MTSQEAIAARTEELHRASVDRNAASMDRLFAGLMIAQWVFALAVALSVSPYEWEGRIRSVHVHVYAAALLGGAINALPIALVLRRPGRRLNRYVIAVAQMSWSALLIHLTGGRIETHFHIFGSLAFLAFYRDWTVLVPATLVVVGDHFVRGMMWPESVYGVASAEWWRFLEHAGWVVFEDVILVRWCLVTTAELRASAADRAQVEAFAAQERAQSEQLARTEKLAAVGQLAASVGHELRNPLTAVRNAASFVTKRVASGPSPDPKVITFLGIIESEVAACARIISELLDFARERAPSRQPTPLRPLVEDAVALLPLGREQVRNEVPDDLPLLAIDKDQFRQILVNLLQNAVEAGDAATDREVVVRAEGGGERPWRITVRDRGAGIPLQTQAQIFEPLFTTKTKGTGLGLAIVANLVRAHAGSIRVESKVGEGAAFHIELPARTADAPH